MSKTNKLSWTVVFGNWLFLLMFAPFLVCCVIAARGEDGNLPATPPALPEQFGGKLVLPTTAEWELTLEYSTDLAFTNTTVYPLTIQVPFEHDSGFVRINARKIVHPQIKPPTEKFPLPLVMNGQVVVLDYFAGTSTTNFFSGSSFSFKVPAWNRWYYLTFREQETLVWEQWVGHFTE